jgi:hypothetical protein
MREMEEQPGYNSDEAMLRGLGAWQADESLGASVVLRREASKSAGVTL